MWEKKVILNPEAADLQRLIQKIFPRRPVNFLKNGPNRLPTVMLPREPLAISRHKPARSTATTKNRKGNQNRQSRKEKGINRGVWAIISTERMKTTSATCAISPHRPIQNPSFP